MKHKIAVAASTGFLGIAISFWATRRRRRSRVRPQGEQKGHDMPTDEQTSARCAIVGVYTIFNIVLLSEIDITLDALAGTGCASDVQCKK